MSSSGERDCDSDAGPLMSTCPRRCDDPVSPRVIDSAALLDGRSQLAILHNETVYFLRQTRFGKLILTK